MSAVSGGFTVDQALTEMTRLSNVMETTGLPPIECYLVCRNSDGDSQKLEELIDKVINFVCKTYGLFPRLREGARQQLWEQGIRMKQAVKDSDLATEEECVLFDSNLKEKIIFLLKPTTDVDTHPNIQLSTDFCPEGLLEEICKASFSQKDKIWQFFPWKTTTKIFINHERTGMILEMQFKSQHI